MLLLTLLPDPLKFSPAASISLMSAYSSSFAQFDFRVSSTLLTNRSNLNYTNGATSCNRVFDPLSCTVVK